MQHKVLVPPSQYNLIAAGTQDKVTTQIEGSLADGDTLLIQETGRDGKLLEEGRRADFKADVISFVEGARGFVITFKVTEAG